MNDMQLPSDIVTENSNATAAQFLSLAFTPYPPSSPLTPMMRHATPPHLTLLTLTQSCTDLTVESQETDTEPYIAMVNTREESAAPPACSPNVDDSSVCSPGSPPLAELLMGLFAVQHDYKFATNGYRIVRKMMDSLQGELYECEIIDAAKREKAGMSRVVIKQVSKELHESGEAQQDEDTVLVEEDVIKEALILKHLTKDNSAYGDYIANFVDFFETKEELFLVMEYAGEITLAQWIKRAFELMESGKLKLAEYKKAVKFMFWQICVAVHWMHHDMDVCHLGLSVDDIVVNNGEFLLDEADGFYHLNLNITAKIVDFGLAEKFHPLASNSHQMRKWALTARHSYSGIDPKMYAEFEFDGLKADIWSLGMILFQLSCGQPLCVLPDEDEDLGFWALSNGKIMHYLRKHQLRKYFGKTLLRLVCGMLEVDEQRRFSAEDVLKCDWFTGYYQRYGSRISKKSRLQKARNLKQQIKMMDFPYYKF